MPLRLPLLILLTLLAELSPAARHVRARLAARKRWSGDDPAELDRLTEQLEREIAASHDDDTLDDIEAFVARAPNLTPEQAARLRRIVSGWQASAPAART